MKTTDTTPARPVSAVGPPLLAIAMWGLFAAPNAPIDRPLLAIGTEILVFGAATAALWAVHYRTAAAVFVIVLVANLLVIRLGQLAP